MIDIVIFALITLFFGYRLFIALGRMSESDADQLKSNPVDDRVVKIGQKSKRVRSSRNRKKDEGEAYDNIIVTPKEKEFEETILSFDGNFSMEQFKYGAQRAFLMIVEDFASGKKERLENLLETRLFNSFEADIDARDEQGIDREVKVVEIENMEVLDVEVEEPLVRLLVAIDSKQIIFEHDRDGNLIEGDEELELSIKDRWVFVRDVNSDDPAYMLEESQVTLE